MSNMGSVFLVGAGPGDPDLLTQKAARIITQANLILYDSLVGPDVLKLASKQAKMVFVGKRMGRHSVPQEQINQMMFESARSGENVVRLKGGDPFLFGRGGEELEFLRSRGVEVEVIPGITSATAASALIQIPLTHRDLGASVIFLSGYTREKDGEEGKTTAGFPEYDWDLLAKESLTLVFYMAQKHLSRICESLMSHGKDRTTPLAVVSNCSLPDQSVVYTTLENASLPEVLERTKFPAVLIIGDVVRLSPYLDLSKDAVLQTYTARHTD